MNNKVFIGGLNYETTEKELESEFSKYGKVINLRIVRHHDTGESKGFGFITFSDSESAEKALAMDGEQFAGRIIGVKPAHDRRK